MDGGKRSPVNSIRVTVVLTVLMMRPYCGAMSLLIWFYQCRYLSVPVHQRMLVAWIYLRVFKLCDRR